MTPGPGIEPGSHWWEASVLTTALSLLPLNINRVLIFINEEKHLGIPLFVSRRELGGEHWRNRTITLYRPEHCLHSMRIIPKRGLDGITFASLSYKN